MWTGMARGPMSATQTASLAPGCDSTMPAMWTSCMCPTSTQVLLGQLPEAGRGRMHIRLCRLVWADAGGEAEGAGVVPVV